MLQRQFGGDEVGSELSHQEPEGGNAKGLDDHGTVIEENKMVLIGDTSPNAHRRTIIEDNSLALAGDTSPNAQSVLSTCSPWTNASTI
jgi:hypothetical protein